jgi:Icc protein
MSREFTVSLAYFFQQKCKKPDMKTLIILLIQFLAGSVFVILMSGCDKFEYNPYQTDNVNRPENLNEINLIKLKSTEASGDDTVTILFTGDSQRFYSSLDALVAKTNSTRGIDLFILAGDVSDFALLQEFLWVNDRLKKLTVPYFCVIGNHDLTANGSVIFEEMFGPKNFSFHYKDYKFLFHDTNGREYNFNGLIPDLEWLTAQLQDSSKQWMVGVSHVPPYDRDFDKQLEMPYKNLLASRQGFILSLNGHLHHGGDDHYYDDNVRYITSYSVGHNKCLLLKLIKGKIIKEEIYY